MNEADGKKRKMILLKDDKNSFVIFVRIFG